ncbi:MAG: tetratricopeptide repeat protein [Treponema sp.]|jgi:tetratricopeptide (TPR) repeat protein|nr:tetratricopeptide repeat protein [Treponema sp.]
MKKILSVLLALLFAGGTAAFAQDGNVQDAQGGDLFPLPEEAIQMEYRLLYERAWPLIQDLGPDGKDAVPLLERMHKLKPEELWPVESLGMVYCYVPEERPSFPKGLPWLLKAEKMNSRYASLYYNLACVYSLRSEPDKAGSAMDKALVYGYWNFDWMEEDEDLVTLRSTSWWKENIAQDEENRIFNAAARLLEGDPDFAGAYFARAQEYVKREDFPKALEQYDRAIECDPDYREAYTYRSWLYLAVLDDPGKGVADYAQAWRRSPAGLNGFARDRFGISGDGQYRFIDDFIRAMQNNPDYAVLFLSGVWEGVYQEERTEEEALEAAAAALTRAIALEPRVAFTYACRGFLYEFTGFDRFLEDLTAAVLMSPDMAEPLIRYFEEDDDDLYAGFARALRNNQDYAALCLRAFLFYAHGDYPGALEYVSRGIRRHPGAALAYRIRGKIYARLGDGAKAKEDAAKAEQRW